MKKLALGGMMLAAVALSAPAMAADMAAPVYKAPVIAPVAFSWTGFYLGANLGYSWGRGDTDFSATTSGTSSTQLFLTTPVLVVPFVATPVGPPTVVTLPTVTAGGSSRADLNGMIGGGQIGYNWQNGSMVYGIEADLQATGQRGDTTICLTAGCPTGGIFGSASYKLPWLGTLRGRLGVAVAPKWLLYATGGLAVGEVDSTFTGGLAGGPIATSSSNRMRAGLVAGGGVEGALDNNWSAKLEALWVDLGSYDTGLAGVTNTTVVNVSPARMEFFQTTTTTTTSGSFHSHVTDLIVRVGLNYRFGGPVVAKY
jgi:outer membrane immunogenic protein